MCVSAVASSSRRRAAKLKIDNASNAANLDEYDVNKETTLKQLGVLLKSKSGSNVVATAAADTDKAKERKEQKKKLREEEKEEKRRLKGTLINNYQFADARERERERLLITHNI